MCFLLGEDPEDWTWSKNTPTLNRAKTWVNSVNRIYDELPFGGTKESGYGKEHGIEALEFYQETKAGVVRWG
ncbi:aldehyde dehydrogenase family protein [Thermus tengchongensis]|uniref:aldehyde dehydrogenase family protein n=1 Tax=Thermus tengchongensis TaxID=1214928 RepID=UPI0022A9D136|nr:aldehyde dehydrogenase family protein [Thermus tengchongensis]